MRNLHFLSALLLFTLLLVGLANSKVAERKAKWFPFVSFPNDNCRGDGGNSWGVCYTSKQCNQAGGRRIGSCAHNYGTCCSVELDGTSGPTVSVIRNLTTIISPRLNNLPRTSHFVFPRQRGVCQLKLDFDRFNILGANKSTALCMKDYMRIKGSVTIDTLEICGQLNSNEHMYLDYGQGNQIEITINTIGTDNDGILRGDYGYKFRVTQIRCDSPHRVPQKCLQYFRNETARVTSFNFPYQQLNNHRYTVCVEQKDPNANLQWSLCPVPTNAAANWRPFSITGKNELDSGPTLPVTPTLPGPSPDAVTTCGADFIEFYVAGKFCLNNFQTVTTPSYEMFVNFDGTEPLTRLSDLTMKCPGVPPYPPTQPGYHPWISADQMIAPGQNDVCVAKPLSSSIDTGNVGFCLVYNSVHRRVL